MLWLSLAFAGPDVVDRFVAAVGAGDDAAAAAICEPGFRDRDTLACADLVEAISGQQLRVGRQASSDDELLVELWVNISGPTPVILLARPIDGTWMFVDGTDVDGGALDTELELPPPERLDLPKGVPQLLHQLEIQDASVCMPELTTPGPTCEQFMHAMSQQVRLQPVQVEQIGKKRIDVMVMVERGGKTIDQGWLMLQGKGRKLKLMGWREAD